MLDQRREEMSGLSRLPFLTELVVWPLPLAMLVALGCRHRCCRLVVAIAAMVPMVHSCWLFATVVCDTVWLGIGGGVSMQTKKKHERKRK